MKWVDSPIFYETFNSVRLNWPHIRSIVLSTWFVRGTGLSHWRRSSSSQPSSSSSLWLPRFSWWSSAVSATPSSRWTRTAIVDEEVAVVRASPPTVQAAPWKHRRRSDCPLFHLYSLILFTVLFVLHMMSWCFDLFAVYCLWWPRVMCPLEDFTQRRSDCPQLHLYHSDCSKSTYSPGSGSRDCEHCEMDQWRYSATAVADSSADDGEEVDSPVFQDAFNRRRSANPSRPDADELAVRWSRSPALSTLSLADWEISGSRITLLDHASSSSGETGSRNDVTPSPTFDFRCSRTPEVGTPSADGGSASSDNDEAGKVRLPLERKRERKWKRHLAAGASNAINRQQKYQRLDENEWI